jgi:SAM-dependent methyltransferase
MNLETLKPYLEKPRPFTPGEPLFLDDPHISAQMLKAHLDPNTDQASRHPETIDRSVKWLIETLDLQSGDSILDLGCGPGLYASRLAQRGLKVTGVDYSRRSIAYAQEYAKLHHLEIEYRYQNYLELADESRFDAALLIYGDFCPLSPEQRGQLLQNIRGALKPGGYFILDVTTPTHRRKYGSTNSRYLVETGFWKPGPHLVLEEGFDYPEQSIFLDQSIVIDEDGDVSVFRNWFQDYTIETITQELEAGGFTVQSAWSDLMGSPLSKNSEWIGLVTRMK